MSVGGRRVFVGVKCVFARESETVALLLRSSDGVSVLETVVDGDDDCELVLLIVSDIDTEETTLWLSVAEEVAEVVRDID